MSLTPHDAAVVVLFFNAKPRDLSTMALRQLSVAVAEFLELGLDVAGHAERILQVRDSMLASTALETR